MIIQLEKKLEFCIEYDLRIRSARQIRFRLSRNEWRRHWNRRNCPKSHKTIENKEKNESFIPVGVTGVQGATMDGRLEHA